MISMDEFYAGTVFVYFGPRTLPFLRRGEAVGKILNIDKQRNAIHVRTYKEGREGEDSPNIDVNLLPIALPNFIKSIKKIVETNEFPLDQESRDLICDWEAKFDAGVVGSFCVPIWEAEKMAWEALVEPHATENYYILSSYPTKSENGQFTQVTSFVQPLLIQRPLKPGSVLTFQHPTVSDKLPPWRDL